MSNFKLAMSKAELKIKEKSPEILLGIGITSGLAAIVTASLATLHVKEILDEREKNLKDVETALNDKDIQKSGKYTEEDGKNDRFIIFSKTVVSIFKLYAPTIGLATLSVVSILSAHKIISGRNAAMVAAYTALQEGFNKYRDNVRKDVGEEKDREYFSGSKFEKKTIVDEETGEKKKVVEEVFDENSSPSVYSKFFDEFNPNWERNAEYNRMFLQNQQNWANDKLKANGYLFLNDVYDMLGIDRTSAGQLVGWVLDKNGDNFVDFGLFKDDETHRAFINNYEKSILLDFNVDGIVYDKI